MTTTWIVAADSSRAKIMQVTDQQARLDDVEDMVNPEARLPERDLRTDAEPRFSGHGGVGKPGEARTSGPPSDRDAKGPVEHDVDMFAKQLGNYLDKARAQNRYDELVVVAPPKFLGVLRAEYTREVEKRVVREVPKELPWFDPKAVNRALGQIMRGDATGA